MAARSVSVVRSRPSPLQTFHPILCTSRAVFVSTANLFRHASSKADKPVHTEPQVNSAAEPSATRRTTAGSKAPLPSFLIEQALSFASKLARNVQLGSVITIDSRMSSETASPVIIDGKATAETIHGELKARVAGLTEKYGRAPGLAVVLVGNRTDSATYVRMKKKACSDIGIKDFGRDLPGDATQEEVLRTVAELNANPDVDGILVQLPLPAHIDENTILDAISHEKDVDGLHPLNVGALATRGRTPSAVACTPKGCIELLKRYKIQIEGKHAVVLGRSNIVGIPVSQLLLKENATVTVCHSKTADIAGVIGTADILVAAIGKANFVKGEWLKPGATVIDVGINSVPDATKKTGYRLVGDVDFESAAVPGRAGAITPVPGGVGPMT
jgi:5,10-methylene-tetrahydrofolate dehydrogenase/methenyl tetrahydrofolate cyclohydrolase